MISYEFTTLQEAKSLKTDLNKQISCSESKLQFQKMNFCYDFLNDRNQDEANFRKKQGHKISIFFRQIRKFIVRIACYCGKLKPNLQKITQKLRDIKFSWQNLSSPKKIASTCLVTPLWKLIKYRNWPKFRQIGTKF